MIVKKPLKVSDIGGIGPTGSNITLNGTNDKLVSFRKKDGGDLISLQDLEKHTIKFFSTTGGLGRLPIETLLNNNYKQAYIQIVTTSDLEPLKLKGLMDYGILHYYPNYLHGNGNGHGTQMVLRYITGTPEIYIRFARNGAGNEWSDWTRFLNERNIENYAVKNRLGFSTPEHINNFRYPTNYETTIQDGTTIGLPEGTGYAYIKHFGWIDSNGNSMQIAMNFGLSTKGTDNFWVMKIRSSNYDSWGPWFTIPTYFSENTHNYGLRDYHTTTDANRVRGTLNIRAGIYGTTVNTPTNVNDDGFIIPIFLDNQTYGVQLYITHYSNKLWIRRIQNGTWQPWFCIANGDSFYFNNENHFCASSAYNHIKTRHIEGDCPSQDGSLYLNWHNGKPVYFKHTDGTVHSIQEVFQLAVDGKNTIINGINTALGYNSGLNTGHTWNDLNWWMLYKVNGVKTIGGLKFLIKYKDDFQMLKNNRTYNSDQETSFRLDLSGEFGRPLYWLPLSPYGFDYNSSGGAGIYGTISRSMSTNSLFLRHRRESFNGRLLSPRPSECTVYELGWADNVFRCRYNNRMSVELEIEVLNVVLFVGHVQ